MTFGQHKAFSVPFGIFGDIQTPGAFRLLIFLMAKSDMHGCCRVSYETIKGESGITSERTIAEGLEVLEKLGWIVKREKGGRVAQVFTLGFPGRCQRGKWSIEKKP